MNERQLRQHGLAKVPAVTLGFWTIMILATTLGETGGDTVTMSWLGETTDNAVPGGYLIGTAIFGVLLVPLVAADRSGNRIGHGKGHYDRAISHLRAAGPVFTIGLAWAPQLIEERIPADPCDMKLDAIATPAEWIACR